MCRLDSVIMNEGEALQKAKRKLQQHLSELGTQHAAIQNEMTHFVWNQKQGEKQKLDFRPKTDSVHLETGINKTRTHESIM